MAEIPKPSEVLGMACALAKGSAVDRPRSLWGAVREFVSDTPPESPLTLRALMARPDYQDLMTSKVAPGDPAFDFELQRYDFSDASAQPTGTTVRISDHRDVQPVALIFGSYP